MNHINTDKATLEELQLIAKITTRTQELMPEISLDRMSLEMDVTAVHCNCGGLRLQDLLDAEDCDFLHDVSGIVRHLDREKIELTRCFVPRFAAKRVNPADCAFGTSERLSSL